MQRKQTLLLTEQVATLDLGGEMLDASIGPAEAATTLLKGGEVQIDLTEF